VYGYCHTTQYVLKIVAMELGAYISQIGVKAFAQKFSITERAAVSYKQGVRKPRPAVAARIIKDSPVTWEGIYKPQKSSKKRNDS